LKSKKGYFLFKAAVMRKDTLGHEDPVRLLFICAQWGWGHAKREIALIKDLLDLDRHIYIDAVVPRDNPDILGGILPHPRLRVLGESRSFTDLSRLVAAQSKKKGELNIDDVVWPLVSNAMKSDARVLWGILSQKTYRAILADESWFALQTLMAQLVFHAVAIRKRNCFSLIKRQKTVFVWMNDFVSYEPGRKGLKGIAISTYVNLALYGLFKSKTASLGIYFGNKMEPKGFFGKRLDPFLIEVGLVYPFDPEEYPPEKRKTLRRRFRETYGYKDSEESLLVIAAIGGLPIARPMLQNLIDLYGQLNQKIRHDYARKLQLHIVGGPTVDPERDLDIPADLSKEIQNKDLILSRSIDNFHQNIAVADLMIIKSGIGTMTEAAAMQVPTIAVPAKNHFEQHHVIKFFREKYRFGVPMEMDDTADFKILYANIKKALSDQAYQAVPNGTRVAANLIYEAIQ
jgi:hypothetical protein